MEEKIDETLKRALKRGDPEKEPVQPAAVPATEIPDSPSNEEKEAFHIVRAILCDTVSPERVDIRKQKWVCAILFDDNRRKPICHLLFDNHPWLIGLYDENKTETKQPLDLLSDIYKHPAQLRQIAQHYLTAPKEKPATVQEIEENGAPTAL